MVFSPGPVRIGAHTASVGQPAQPGAELLQVSSATQVVTVELEVADRTLVAEGDEVTVELPDESEVAATIASIGSVAEATTDESRRPDRRHASRSSSSSRRRGHGPRPGTCGRERRHRLRGGRARRPGDRVVALLGGGYAVEVPDGPTTRLVAVEPGLYADGYVEVEGELAEGDAVLVPA